MVCELHADFFFLRACHAHPSPFAGVVAGVEIQTAGPDGGHIHAIEAFAQEGVVGPNERRVRLEANHHASAIPTQFPHGGSHLPIGNGRKAIKPPLAFEITKGSALDSPSGDIVPRYVWFNDRRARGGCWRGSSGGGCGLCEADEGEDAGDEAGEEKAVV